LSRHASAADDRVVQGYDGELLGAAVGGVPPGNRIFFAVPPDPAPRALVVPLVRGGRARVLSPPGADPVLILER